MRFKPFVVLILILICLFFSSCKQELTVDRRLFNNEEIWELNGKSFPTLQEAVDSLPKAPEDYVIKLMVNASGPGAEISGKELTIDFNNHAYAFTDVTGLYGEEGGTFGLTIDEGSVVVIKGLEKVSLKDTSTNKLTMILAAGEGTEVEVEGSANLSVEDNQYVFWAKDSAAIRVGAEASSLIKLNGNIGSTDAANIYIQGKTTVESEEMTVSTDGKIYLNTEKQADGKTGVVDIGTARRNDSSTAAIVVGSAEDATVYAYVNENNAIEVATGGNEDSLIIGGVTLSFDANGGEGSISPVGVRHGSSVILPSSSPFTREGYIFFGWALSADGDKEYEDQDTMVVYSDTTLYAYWSPSTGGNTYTVAYNNNESTSGTVPVTQIITLGDSFSIQSNTGNLEKLGFNFDGWNTKSDGTGTNYAESQSITSDLAAAGEVVTLYAKWTPVAGLLPIGGRIYYVYGDSVSGAANGVLTIDGVTYTFYDSDGNQLTTNLSDKTASFMVSYTDTGIGNAVYYTKTGTSTKTSDNKDSILVTFLEQDVSMATMYDGTTGIMWSTEDSTHKSSIPKTDGTQFMGQGKIRTNLFLSIESTSDDYQYYFPTGLSDRKTIWQICKEANEKKVNGFSDWFVPSEAELISMFNAVSKETWEGATTYSTEEGSFVWSSSFSSIKLIILGFLHGKGDAPNTTITGSPVSNNSPYEVLTNWFYKGSCHFSVILVRSF